MILTCLHCSGTRYVYVHWVDGDLRERRRRVSCHKCAGKGTIEVAVREDD